MKSDKQVICTPPPTPLFPFLWGVSLNTSSLKCIVTRPAPTPHPGGRWPSANQRPVFRSRDQYWPIRGRQGVRGPQTGNGWSLCYTEWEIGKTYLKFYFEILFKIGSPKILLEQTTKMYQQVRFKITFVPNTKKVFIWKQYLKDW